jgi:hypothetical protein
MAFLQPGDLVLRDLGYFAVKALKEIAGAGAFFLSRFRVGTSLFSPDTREQINILSLLKAKGALDRPLLLGAGEWLRVRLVAIPVPPEIAEQRRRKAKNDRDKRYPPSKEKLALMGWEIFVTNIPLEQMTSTQIRSLYGLRWRIEIIFKAWKSSLNFTDFTCTAGENQVQVLIIGRMIHGVMMQKAWSEWHACLKTTTGKRLSLLKTSARISHNVGLFIRFISNPDPDSNLAGFLATHCAYEPRKRKNHSEILEGFLLEAMCGAETYSLSIC